MKRPVNQNRRPTDPALLAATAAAVRGRRQARGYTQLALSRLLGYTGAVAVNLICWEMGSAKRDGAGRSAARVPDLPNLMKLHRTLGLDLTDIQAELDAQEPRPKGGRTRLDGTPTRRTGARATCPGFESLPPHLQDAVVRLVRAVLVSRGAVTPNGGDE